MAVPGPFMRTIRTNSYLLSCTLPCNGFPSPTGRSRMIGVAVAHNLGPFLECLRKLVTLLNVSSRTSPWWLSSPPGYPPNSSDCFHSHQCPLACSTRFFGMCVTSPAPDIAPSLSMGMSSDTTPFHLSPLSPRSRAGNKDWVHPIP